MPIFRMRWCRFLAVAIGLAAAGVLGDGQRAQAEPKAASGPAAPAIRIALLPERNIFEQKKRYQPLQEYLSAALGRAVVFTLLDDYQLIFDEIGKHRVDGAFFSSTNGAIAQMTSHVEMLARPVDLRGRSTYASVVFAAAGNGVAKDPRTWKGRRVAFVSRATTSYLYALSLLRRAGHRGDPAPYFGHLTFAGSHDAVILAVLEGQAELGACKSTVYDDYLERHPGVGSRLSVLGVSAEVPANALGVHPDLSPEIRRALREALLGMHANERGQEALRHFGAQRFVETRPSDYEPVFGLARQAGEDLATWPVH